MGKRLQAQREAVQKEDGGTGRRAAGEAKGGQTRA